MVVVQTPGDVIACDWMLLVCEVCGGPGVALSGVPSAHKAQTTFLLPASRPPCRQGTPPAHTLFRTKWHELRIMLMV